MQKSDEIKLKLLKLNCSRNPFLFYDDGKFMSIVKRKMQQMTISDLFTSTQGLFCIFSYTCFTEGISH